MSNSALVSYTSISPNSTNPRTSKIDKITIHHMAGNISVETCARVFKTRKASANYGVGSDGRIALYVDEANRAWTSSNPANDHRAVTIEVANDGGPPDWHVSDNALEATIALCVDICKRNGIPALNYTGNKTGNLTMHKWFTATACPGPYLESKFGYIADEVNKRLNPPKPEEPAAPAAPAVLKVGDVVTFTGSTHYGSANATTGWSCKPGKAKLTSIYKPGESKHPYHIVRVSGEGSTVYGWVDAADVAEAPAPAEPWTPAVGDVVEFTGQIHYGSANAATGAKCKPGKAKITAIHKLGVSKHPYHLVRVSGKGSTVYGWVDAGTFKKA